MDWEFQRLVFDLGSKGVGLDSGGEGSIFYLKVKRKVVLIRKTAVGT